MLFRTGNPNLVDRTRVLAGNPSTEPSLLYATQDVEDAINIAFEELVQRARHLDVGWGVKSTTGSLSFDPNDPLILYSLPADLDGKVLDIRLTKSTDSTFSLYLDPKDAETCRRGYYSGDLTSTKYYYIQGLWWGVVSPPAESTGIDGYEITYQGSFTHLSADDDEPIEIPVSHHDLGCLLAAMDLRASKDLGFSDLATIAARKFPNFIEVMQEPIDDMDSQFTTVGRTARRFHTRSGFVSRY